ncbi:hypothetical protein [Streptosporangium sp. CA-115845]
MLIDTDAMPPADSLKSTLNGKPFPNKTWTETLLQVGWTNDRPSVPALP